MITLNKKQCQQLKHILAELINKEESIVDEFKIKCAALYLAADTNSNYGKSIFELLNVNRTNLRLAKQRVKNLVELQKTVKERLKYP